jgi:hypothetical protein
MSTSSEEFDHDDLMNMQDAGDEEFMDSADGTNAVVVDDNNNPQKLTYARSEKIARKTPENNQNNTKNNSKKHHLAESTFSLLGSESAPMGKIVGKKAKKGQQPPPPPPPPSQPLPNSPNVIEKKSETQIEPNYQKHHNNDQQQQQQQQHQIPEKIEIKIETKLPESQSHFESCNSFSTVPNLPNTPPPSIKHGVTININENTPSAQQPQLTHDILISNRGNNILFLNEDHTPTNHHQAASLSSYQKQQQQQQSQSQSQSQLHNYNSPQNYHHNDHNESNLYSNSLPLHPITTTPSIGRVETTFVNKPTRPINPVPAPVDLFSVPIPVVNRNDLSFHVDDPFPVADSMGRIVYYFPIIITSLYVYTHMSPLSFTCSSTSMYSSSAQLNNSSLSVSSPGNMNPRNPAFPAYIIDEFSKKDEFMLESYQNIDIDQYQSFSWTINVRFSEFDQLYQRLADIYPHLPPQLSKMPDTKPDIVALRRRQMLQDLIHSLYDLPFVRYTPEWNLFFQFSKYVTLFPFIPHITQHAYDLYGQSIKHHYSKDLNGMTLTELQKLRESSPTFSNQFQYGLNNSYCRVSDNILFTPVQYNSIMTKVSKIGSFWSGPSLVKKCDKLKDAYGGVIAWIFNETTYQWNIHSILGLDTNVDYVTAANLDGSNFVVYLGCDNGQLIKTQWSARSQFQSFVPIFAHSKQICGLFTPSGNSEALISVGREGSIVFRDGWNAKEIFFNIGESLLSSACVNQRYLVLGADSGNIIIFDMYYGFGIEPHTASNLNPLSPRQQPQQLQPDPNKIHSVPHGPFTPKLIYCAQHHNHGIRYITSHCGVLSFDQGSASHGLGFDNSGNQRGNLFCSEQRYNSFLPYNELKQALDTPYYVNFGKQIRVTTVNSEGTMQQQQQQQHNQNNPHNQNTPDNTQLTTSLLTPSSYSIINAPTLMNETNPGQEQINSPPQQQQQQHNHPQHHHHHHHNPSNSNIHQKSHDITYIITCSHDGTNKLFILNQIDYQSTLTDTYSSSGSIYPPIPKSIPTLSAHAIPFSPLHPQALLQIAVLQASPSHCAVFCNGTPYFVTSHNETSAKLLVWDSNALKQGPIIAISTFSAQTTSMVWLENSSEVLATARDGSVRIYSLKSVIEGYEKEREWNARE